MKILIVEDELDIQESLVEGFILKGYITDYCSDGETAIKKCYEENYDLIVLDINIPIINGLKVLEKIREFNKTINVIILSANDFVVDKVNGLDLGANDYLTKPFSFLELEARVRSLLRRKVIIEDVILKYKTLEFDTISKIVSIDDEQIKLTNKELAILECFLLNNDKLITLETIIESVWDSSANPFSNSVRMHLSSLRKKLREKLGEDPIENVIGCGYRLKEQNK